MQAPSASMENRTFNRSLSRGKEHGRHLHISYYSSLVVNKQRDFCHYYMDKEQSQRDGVTAQVPAK